MTNKEKIVSHALEILKKLPQGIRYTDFVNQVHAALPQIPINTVHGIVWNLEVREPQNVFKPARGMYLHTGLPSVADLSTSVAGAKPHKFRFLSLPFYLINQTKRLCRETMG